MTADELIEALLEGLRPGLTAEEVGLVNTALNKLVAVTEARVRAECAPVAAELSRAIHGGCTWHLGADMVRAERVLDAWNAEKPNGPDESPVPPRVGVSGGKVFRLPEPTTPVVTYRCTGCGVTADGPMMSKVEMSCRNCGHTVLADPRPDVTLGGE